MLVNSDTMILTERGWICIRDYKGEPVMTKDGTLETPEFLSDVVPLYEFKTQKIHMVANEHLDKVNTSFTTNIGCNLNDAELDIIATLRGNSLGVFLKAPKNIERIEYLLEGKEYQKIDEGEGMYRFLFPVEIKAFFPMRLDAVTLVKKFKDWNNFYAGKGISTDCMVKAQLAQLYLTLSGKRSYIKYEKNKFVNYYTGKVEEKWAYNVHEASDTIVSTVTPKFQPVAVGRQQAYGFDREVVYWYEGRIFCEI